jgi:broad specificity phosphatase PhoE
MFNVNPWCRALVLALVALTGCATPPSPQPKSEVATTIFLVRHAEKDPTPGLKDPALTEAGQRRAEALRDTMRPHPLAALYSTDTTRTRATLAPLVAARGLEPWLYEARQPEALVALLRERHPGQTVLVVGHSNTLLPLIEALGAPRPVPELTDTDYDYLFEVTLRPEGASSVRVHRYGAGHP